MKKFYPVNEPLLDGNEKKYLNECIDSNWISSEGPFVKKFQNQMAQLCQRQYAIALSSGTSALELACLALDIKESDEVIIPNLTIISCSNAVVKAGAKPVFVDVCPETLCLDPQQIEAKITTKTKAIMIVHLYGLACDVDPILEIAKKHNLKVIEDAAEAHGLKYKGKPCGSFGDISIFSFYANKLVSCGEGGMALTNDDALFNRINFLKDQAFEKERRFKHNEIGFNMRMTNLQAAVGVAQLERLEEFIQIKQSMAEVYDSYLNNLKNVKIAPRSTEYCQNIYWIYGLILDTPELALKAQEQLREKGIGTRPFFYPLHQQPLYKEIIDHAESFPISEHAGHCGFYIPSGLNLKEQDWNYIGETLKDVLMKVLND
tara:strand:- start:72375 stop:73499 length:1125 start_codon:yes stop_codon:yes gene_type:complete